MSSVPYSNAVGSIIYAMICTRPDIAQAVSIVSRYMSNSGKAHSLAVMWFLRYFRCTSSTCIKYASNNDRCMICGFQNMVEILMKGIDFGMCFVLRGLQ